mmetsp:Transcript_2225/g.3086  ORF Transcript_2225/g.3086 Transcript_2225/m.3086 type:complete len:461 (+) Transcript_2225:139-1521(+)
MIKWTSKNEDNILEQASGGLLKEIPGEKEIELDEEAIDKGVSQRLTALVLKKFERILQEDIALDQIPDQLPEDDVDEGFMRQLNATLEFLRDRYKPFAAAREEEEKDKERHELQKRKLQWIAKNVHTGAEDVKRKWVQANDDFHGYNQYLALRKWQEKTEKEAEEFQKRLEQQDDENKWSEEAKKYNQKQEEIILKSKLQQRASKARKRREDKEHVKLGKQREQHFKPLGMSGKLSKMSEEISNSSTARRYLEDLQDVQKSSNKITHIDQAQHPGFLSSRSKNLHIETRYDEMGLGKCVGVQAWQAAPPTPPPTVPPKKDRVIFTGFGTVVDIDKAFPKKKKTPEEELEVMLSLALKTATAKLENVGVQYPPPLPPVTLTIRQKMKRRVRTEVERMKEKIRQTELRERLIKKREKKAKAEEKLQRLSDVRHNKLVGEFHSVGGELQVAQLRRIDSKHLGA